MSKKNKVCYRRPTDDEQQVLEHMTVRLVGPDEVARYDRHMVQHHYLESARVVGEHLRYVVSYRGQWLALATWSAAAFHLKARDTFIAWTEEQRRRRLALVVNNTRLCVLPDCHYPNLISRFMKLMLGRLAEDWQAAWGHPVVLAETFVDPQQFQGTAYRVSGWSQLGRTAGWKRSADDFYAKHDRPKQVWVRELVKRAGVKLRAPTLPPTWAVVEAQVPPRCTARVAQMRSLREHLERVPDFRRRQSLGYPLSGMLALIALALFSGVRRGPEELAAYAATLSQDQLRTLKFRRHRHTRQVRCPGVTTFRRVLTGVDAAAVERALLLWQEQVLGPTQDRVVIADGKTLRHAGVDLVSAVNGQGRWLGTVVVPEGTNEIPLARQLLAKVDLTRKLTVADAAHTQIETAQQILFEGGGDYLLTVKENQKQLVKTLTTLLDEQGFSPATGPAAPSRDPGAQPGTPRTAGVGGLCGDAGASRFSRGADDRQTGPPHPAPRPGDHGNRLPDQQPDPAGTGCPGVTQAQAALLGD